MNKKCASFIVCKPYKHRHQQRQIQVSSANSEDKLVLERQKLHQEQSFLLHITFRHSLAFQFLFTNFCSPLFFWERGERTSLREKVKKQVNKININMLFQHYSSLPTPPPVKVLLNSFQSFRSSYLGSGLIFELKILSFGNLF